MITVTLTAQLSGRPPFELYDAYERIIAVLYCHHPVHTCKLTAAVLRCFFNDLSKALICLKKQATKICHRRHWFLMAAPRSRLLELDDEVLVHILSRLQGSEQAEAANACRRLCKLVSLDSIEKLRRNRASSQCH
jgi:hypothetical protein